MEGKGAISWDFDSARNNKIWKVNSSGWAKTVSFEISLVLYRTGGHDANQITFTWFSLDPFDRVAIFGILYRVGYAAKLTKDYGWQQSELDGES